MRKKLPLGQKLEGLIIRLFQTICDPGFQATYYPPINKSFFLQTDDDEDEE